MTIDDIVNKVIAESEIINALDISDENRSLYVKVIKSDLRKKRAKNFNPEKKKDPYFKFLVDKIAVFGYLMRDQEVLLQRKWELIDTDKRLHLLKVYAAHEVWEYKTLVKMNARLYTASKAHGLPRYTQLIDEIGKIKEVRELWGRTLTYEKDFSIRHEPRGRKPRPKRMPGVARARRISTHRR